MKETICRYMRRLCDMGLTTSLGGNISCLDEETGQILVTPSGIDKYSLTPEDLVTVDRDGRVVSGDRKPTMEYMMHVGIYQARPEMRAVVHAHPPFASLYACLNEPIDTTLTLEFCKSVGEIGMVDLEIMGTQELADLVKESARTHRVMLMRNHGPVTCGRTLQEAFNLLELTEMAAKLTWLARGHDVCPVSASVQAVLRTMRK